MRTERSKGVFALAGFLTGVLCAWGACPAQEGARGAPLAAAREARERPAAGDEDAFAARRLLEKAQELLAVQEYERGVKMLESIIEQHRVSPVRYQAYLALGKHYLETRQQQKAVSCLLHLRELKKGEEELTGEPRELYCEGLYLCGVAYFQLKQYGSSFPLLRKITVDYPNSVWANQAYHYIGMCHFAQGNWDKAIRNLSLVGTFVDPDSPTVDYVEAGRRFYVKVDDGDLPVLRRLGRAVTVEAATAQGDREILECIPLSETKGTFIGSVATELGAVKAGDGTLQVVGGDAITVRYLDDNTKDGRKDVIREKAARVVSTGAVSFTMGSYESKAPAAFIGQPLFVLLMDADQDKSPRQDAAIVKVVSRYKEEEPAEEAPAVGADLDARQEQRWVVRDEVVLRLTEEGDGPAVHSGRFAGSVPIQAWREDQPADKADQVLTCAVNDQVVATYVDELHVGGDSPRQVEAKIQVVGEIDSSPRATQNVVPDPVLRSRKNLVEATAYLELARIFKSMGLREGAILKANEGLERAEPVIMIQTPIPSSLKEEAFRLKWELYIVQENYPGAIATCKLFNRLYPDSPFVDQALMGIGKIKFDNKEFKEAMQIFKEVLDLPTSQAKAEAQFMIACSIEAEAEAAAEAAVRAGSKAPARGTVPETAIQQYKLCAERYPESEFAGKSLGKLVDYYIGTRDFAHANELLEQVFADYPDAGFLDDMLLKWTILAYTMGDYRKAHEKCSQLIFEHPASPGASKAKQFLPKIKERLEGPKEGGAGGGSSEGSSE